MAKDETEIGITGQPIPKKKRSPKKQYEFEKKRRENLGKNVGGLTYRSDTTPYLNPRSVREEVLVDYLLAEGFASDEKSAEAILGAMSEAWVDSIVEEMLDEEKKEFPSDRVRQQSARHEKNYITRPNSYAGQRSKSKSKKMKAIASTVEVGDDPRNTLHGQDLRKIR
jgi:Fe-S-cluster formation regulator IscX/YfhJ